MKRMGFMLGLGRFVRRPLIATSSTFLRNVHMSTSFVAAERNEQTQLDQQIEQLYNNNQKEFCSPEGSKLLRVALIGMPNAGKSTLINTLLQYEVCPASKRVHTTRKPQKAIFLEDNTQIVFIDTPGLVGQREIEKFSFNKDFSMGPRKSIKSADIVAVIQDISDSIPRNRLDKRITSILNQYMKKDKQVVLILNKVDLLDSKRKLLDSLHILTNGFVGGCPIPFEIEEKVKKLTKEDILRRAAKKLEAKEKISSQSRTDFVEESEENMVKTKTEDRLDRFVPKKDISPGWSHFQEVFMISSLIGDGVEVFKDHLIKQAKDSKWDYAEEVLTDYSPPDLALLILKSKMLDHISAEVPYVVKPVLEIWEENDTGGLTVVIGIHCPNARILKCLIGLRGSTVTLITQETERSLTKLLRRNVSLHIKATCPEEK